MPRPAPILSAGFNRLIASRHGVILLNINDVYIGRSLDCYGEYSEGEVRLFDQLANPGDTVVEVGANIGAHTLPLAKRVGAHGRVLAFEPQRIVFQTLCANMALNGLSNVDCRHAAVGDASGDIRVPQFDFSAIHNFGGLSLGTHAQGELVPMVMLDDLELPACRLLKVDVEGMELAVLRGAQETLRRCRPILYVENDREQNSPALIEFVLQSGYRPYWHLPPLFNPDNYFGNSENVFSGIVSVNMLCLPPEVSAPNAPLGVIDSPAARWRSMRSVDSGPAISDGEGERSAGGHELDSLLRRAQVLFSRRDWPGTEQICQRALRRDEKNALALRLLASAAINQSRFESAVDALERLAEIEPDDVSVHQNLGAAYGSIDQFAKAAESLQRALRLQPDHVQASVNLANVWRDLGHLEESIAECRHALSVDPNSARAYLHMANALVDLGDFAEAESCYEQALRLKPGFALGHKNLGILQLRCGRWDTGWEAYEWRWKADGLQTPQQRFPQPLWDGSPLHGRTILLYGEQGLGDQIQFVRYADEVARRGGQVVVQVDARILRLLRGVLDVERMVGDRDTPPVFDTHAPLMSLPHLLNMGIEQVPHRAGYLLSEPERCEHWRRKLSKHSGLRVGLFWQGSKGKRRDRFRSIPLTMFEPLTRVPGVQLISLQKGDGEEQLVDCPFRDQIVHFGHELDGGPDAFVDTAAVIDNLDLVITCDSAVGHVGGALGRRTWILLQKVSDWRWLTERTDTAWYDSARLFRQPVRDDWASLMERVAESLHDLPAGRDA